MTIPTLHEVTWQTLPYQPVARAAAITGRSPAHVYALVKSGTLRAVKLAGKTLITTESIVELLGGAQPWSPNHDRVAPAHRARLARPRQSNVGSK
jgi:hypothetical protein